MTMNEVKLPGPNERKLFRDWAGNNTPGKKGFQSTGNAPKMSNSDWENHIAESTADYSRMNGGFESRASAVLSGGDLLGTVYDVGMGEPGALGRLEHIMSNRPVTEMSTYNLELSHGGVGKVLSEFHQSRLSSRLEGHLAGKKSADALGIETDAKGATALRARLRDAGYSSTSGSGRGRSWTTHTKGSHRVIVTKLSGYAVNRGYAPFSVDSLTGVG